MKTQRGALETSRMRLIPVSACHLEGLAKMIADSAVMAHLPSTMSHAETAALLGRIQCHRANNDFGLFALIRKADHAFLGFTGLTHPSYETPFTPCV